MVLIYIQGEPISPFHIVSSELEQSILQQKQLSRTPYYYASFEELRFELRVRAAIVHAALMLGESGAAFDTFENSRCNERFWTLDMKGGFRLKPTVHPSDAIEDIYIHGHFYAFECAMGIVVVLYKAVLDIIGREQFDRFFDRLYLYSWHHDADLKLITVHAEGEGIPGDVQYFKNPEVDPESMQWQGVNVIVMPGGRYFGHGTGVSSAWFIIRLLNRHRIPGAQISAYLMDETTFPNFKYLHQLANGNAAGLREPLSAGPGTIMGPGGLAPPDGGAGAGFGAARIGQGFGGESAMGMGPASDGAGTFTHTYRLEARIGSRTHLYG